MATFYSVALVLVSTAHLLFGLGNLLKVPPYKPSSFIVNGQPGTGESPIEKLLEAVLAGWYISSILGVILAYFFSTESLKFTLLCPLIYHVMSTYTATYYIEDWGSVTNMSALTSEWPAFMESCRSCLFTSLPSRKYWNYVLHL